MSSHTNGNHRARLRVLCAGTGVALLVGGGFAAQAVADASTAPRVTTTGHPARQAASHPGVSKSAGTPRVVKAGKPTDVGDPGARPGPAENAPRVIRPGRGVQK